MSAGILENRDSGASVFTAPDPGLQPLGPINTVTRQGVPSSLQASVGERVLGGTSALGLGIFIERGCGFLANIVAARFAGTSTFGAYSLAISTANQISTYAAGGIGATAARFSGKYPRGTPGYSTLARALTVVSVVSAALAVLALYLGAGPLAHLLLHKPQLTHLLRWASISAAGIILLECARGFFVGQRRLTAVVLLSVVVGFGMITLLPAAAHMHSPIRMIALQGAITTSAVAVCLLLSGPLALRAPATHTPTAPLAPMLREVWSFGAVQLLGLIGSNLAGWWLTILVARADTTLVQMSFFAIASQLRNIVGIAPSLLTEGSYAVMADPGGEATRTPHRVMALCTYASICVALLLAAAGILVVPWALTLLYGHAYDAAGIAVAIALAIAVVHMGNAPAAARLTIVSIRSTGVINTIWAVFVAAAATFFLFRGGTAWQAMAIYFAGHVLSSILVLATLHHKDRLPPGMALLFAVAAAGSAAFAALAWLRAFHPVLTLPITATMFALSILLVVALYRIGKRFAWLPSATVFTSLTTSLRARLPRRPRHV